MSKLFSFGIVLGLALSAAAVSFVPFTDLHREASIISVQTNGRNAEVFRILLPDDRIVAAGSDRRAVTPDELNWPEHVLLAGVEVELFKLRNRDNVVVGVASRIAATAPQSARAVEWTLHLPARGTLYVPMTAAGGREGVRTGALRAGTQEFEGLEGNLSERYSATADGGRIELRSMLVGMQRPDDGLEP